jgi:phosphatidylglycerol:prolipoprotein diacylglycerol transferase
MALTGMFLLWYGAFRFFVEFFRLPDADLGYLAFGWVTMGQILSAPMIIAGAVMLLLAYRGHEGDRVAA